MRIEYHSKPVNFVPPLLRRRFIAPDNPREMGTLVMLFGLAIVFVSAWAGVMDFVASIGKKTALGERVAVAPYRSGNAARMVGVYVFVDEQKVPLGVRASRVYFDKAKVPKQARIIWPRARPQRARVVYQYLDHLFGLPIGFVVVGFGLWLSRKRIDAFETAMGRGEERQDDKSGDEKPV
jgi:hypothetical protein